MNQLTLYASKMRGDSLCVVHVHAITFSDFF